MKEGNGVGGGGGGDGVGSFGGGGVLKNGTKKRQLVIAKTPVEFGNIYCTGQNFSLLENYCREPHLQYFSMPRG